jgi:hypothetical protein
MRQHRLSLPISTISGQPLAELPSPLVCPALLLSCQATDLSFDPHTPAATFANEQFSQLFFKTTACLRIDQSTCFPETSEW